MPQQHIDNVIEQLQNGITFKKCWPCACNQDAVIAIESQLTKLSKEDQENLKPVIEESKKHFVPKEYDCLGCKICFPAIATNEFTEAYPEIVLPADGCADNVNVEERTAWPPLPGNYEISRYEAPVAICTLNSKELISELHSANNPHISLIGSLNTENLGIERVVKNIITNPNIRFLILCGEDSEQKIGHLPGQSLLSLHKNGMGKNKTIIGAQGKRPTLKNIDAALIDHFRSQVELINMIGCKITSTIIQMIEFCGKKNPGTYQGGVSSIIVPKIPAHPPKALVLDPQGYFIIFPEKAKKRISVEHYHNNGTLNQIIEGRDIGHIYMTIIELDLVSRLDHACYLGKELARAEASLLTGSTYLQDKAQDVPEIKNSVCDSKGCC